MPTGALTVMWVPKLHTVLTQYTLGWNFVADADIAAMTAAGAVQASGGGGSVPARNLPPIERSPFTPVARVTAPPGPPSAP